MLRHINFLPEEEPQEGMEKIYVKCSREKEEIFRQKSVKFWENIVFLVVIIIY